MVVDLPAPLGPRNPVTCPGSTVKDRWSTAALPPYILVRSRGSGHAYWRSISPFHGVVFGGMLKNITATAEQAERAGDTPLPVSH